MGNHHGIEPKTLKACREFNYRIIATVRNPWDVIVSWWHHNQNWFGPTNSEFPRFVSRFPIDGRNNYMAEGRLYWRWTQHATHIIKYERLEADLSRVIRQPVSLPHIGESDRKPYQDYYDAELRAFVAEAFAPEIEEFKYTFQRRKR
jgi:hypothetical protein